jgi:redox-sensitive bicupin YhaK (pirin superfamily)
VGSKTDSLIDSDGRNNMTIKKVENADSVVRQSGLSSIEHIVAPEPHDLGGFAVRRALPAPERRMVGPWIFFDHMGPADFAPGEGVDVRPHPHINLATVTYLFRGEILHRDSLGNELPISPGDINLMIAGKGIVHSERQRAEIKAKENRLEGLQLWLALPEADEEMEPEFHHYEAAELPDAQVADASVRILIGEAYGQRSPVRMLADTLYLEIRLPAGNRLQLPQNVEESAIYLVTGRLGVNADTIDQHTMAILNNTGSIEVHAVEDAHFVVIGGQRLSRRHIWWNFVSSRRDRIEQAKRDWQAGAFPTVPNDEDEFIPLPGG